MPVYAKFIKWFAGVSMATVSPEGLSKALDKIFKDNKDITLAKSNQALRATVIDSWGEIIGMTPVKDGSARGAWQVTVGAPSTGVGKKSKTKGGNYVLTSTKKDMFGEKWFLTNNLPYIIKLEFGGYGTANPVDVTSSGFSKQAAEGMVRVTLVKFNGKLAKAFKGNV